LAACCVGFDLWLYKWRKQLDGLGAFEVTRTALRAALGILCLVVGVYLSLAAAPTYERILAFAALLHMGALVLLLPIATSGDAPLFLRIPMAAGVGLAALGVLDGLLRAVFRVRISELIRTMFF
jgi:hypothetical protein